MSYKLNGIDIQYLLESGGTNTFSSYTGTNRPTYKDRDTNNNIEELTYPLNYRINSVDINTFANAYSQLYTAVGSVSVSTLIQKTTDRYYKHISAIICGGGGGAGGAGGQGYKGYTGFTNGNRTNGGRGGNGAPSHVLVIRNQSLLNSTQFVINVGIGGASGNGGASAPGGFSSAKSGDPGNDGTPGTPSSISFGSSLYITQDAQGGGGGGGGNTANAGGGGADRTAIADTFSANTTFTLYEPQSRINNNYGVGGLGDGAGQGTPGTSGFVKVWFLYQN
jgi:hypothetical protein